MKLKLIEDNKSFLQLQNDWDRLAGDLIPVNSFEWIYKWWQHFKGNNILKLIVVENDEKIIGIAPLYIENSFAWKFIPFRKLCFLGGNISDYLDFLIDDEHREKVFNLLMNFIFKNIYFDQIELSQICAHYPNFYLWQRYFSDIGLVAYNECPGIDLMDYSSYDDYFKKMNKNLKGSIKFRTGKIRKHGHNIEYVFRKNITNEDINVIAEINLKRQKFLQEKGDDKRFCYFTDKNKNSFIRDFFCKNDKEDAILAYATIDGEIVAYDLILVDKDRLSLWNCAFDPDYNEYSPLKLLINEIIKYAFDNNFNYVDFMRGNDKYKIEWSNDISMVHKINKDISAKAKIVSLYRNLMPKLILKTLRGANKDILH